MRIEQLEQYARLKMEVQINEERILEAFNSTQIPAMKQGDGSQRTAGSGDRQESATLRYMELKDRLQPQIDANKAQMRRIEDAISSLSDPMQREVLRIRYTDTTGWEPMKWRLVALRMYGDDDDKNITAANRIFRKARESLEGLP